MSLDDPKTYFAFADRDDATLIGGSLDTQPCTN